MEYRVIPRIIVYGGPGSGKSTLCAKIAEIFQVVHVSTGDILRAAMAEGTALGKEVKMYANRGELVPDDEMIEIALERLRKEDCITKGWVLDGYPRTKPQLEALVKAGHVCSIFINLDLSKELMRERVLNRRSDPITKQIYNLITQPPPEDEGVLERLIERHDDNEKAFVNQIDAFDENNKDIIAFYKECTVQIDCNRKSSVVWDELNYKLHKCFKYEIILCFGDNSSLTAPTLADNYEYTYLHMDTLLAQQKVDISVSTSSTMKETSVVVDNEKSEGNGEHTETTTTIISYDDIENKMETKDVGDGLTNEEGSSKECEDESKKLPATEYGSQVTSEVMVSVLEEAMKKANVNKFIIEGFPRNYENFKHYIGSLGIRSTINFAIFYDGSLQPNRIADRLYLENITPVLQELDLVGKLRNVSTVSGGGISYFYSEELIKGMNLIEPFSRTLAILKPDLVIAGKIPEIVSAIYEAKLSIVQSMFVKMNLEVIFSMYPHLIGQPEMKTLQEYLCSAPCYVMVLEGRLAVQRWKVLADSLREKYTTVENEYEPYIDSVYYSITDMKSFEDINFWFKEGNIGFKASIESPILSDEVPRKLSIKDIRDLKSVKYKPSNMKKENILAFIHPIFSMTNYSDLVAIMKAHGFEIVSERRETFDAENLEAMNILNKPLRGSNLYKVKEAYFTSSVCIALHLRRQGAIKSMRFLLGPENTSQAKEERVDSIRSQYGIDELRHVISCSTSIESAERELNWLFRFEATAEEQKRRAKKAAMERRITQVEKESVLEDDPMDYNAVKSVLPQPLVSASEKKRMLHYMQNDINVQLTDFISKTITTRPPDFYEFAINEFTEQKKALGVLPPSSKGGVSPVKLAPLPVKDGGTNARNVVESTEGMLEEIFDAGKKHLQESVSSSDMIPRKVSLNVNRNMELYSALEDAKLEIEHLKASISQISLNCQEGAM